jgi:hypothetical protein
LPKTLPDVRKNRTDARHIMEKLGYEPPRAIYDSNARGMIDAAARLFLSLAIAGAVALAAAPLSAKEPGRVR